MSDRLRGHAAIITGAGSGIGRATALRLIADGADVLAVDRNGEGAAETARLAKAGPQDAGWGRCIAETRDITDTDAPAAMVESCKQAFGGVTILVNNAGIGASTAVHQTKDEDLDRFLDINLRALFRCAGAAVTAIREGGPEDDSGERRKGGVIINIASIYGIMGVPGSSIYSATKAAVIGLTRNMAADYGPDNIRVNAIAPGMILTPMNRDRFETNEYFRDMTLNATPLGRVGAPEDIANGIAFLCSDDASFISGHVLAIDGAWSATKFRPFPGKADKPG